ncbi:DUF4124 domain-containing protein [Thioalkalivibrio sp. AKL12]|uniref:DUF4124 domain-containing protein n=1 Tax=Thioalkalivibrio sp. AKL12 TaxID=1158159 RepID=UPI0003627B99|nr:DUF4124 domain-containing protein [Thioalkalivibrio sp. AKL12]
MFRIAVWLALPLAALLAPALLSADVYRWTDDQGNVHFGDRPPEGSRSESVDVREPMRGVPLEGAREILERPVRPRGQPEAEGAYQRVAIARPGDGEGVRANDGNVTAELEIEPALDADAGHRVVWLLDGEAAGEGASTSTTFQGLNRGAYTLQARVVDESGQELGASDTIEFNVLRMAIPRSQQQQQRPQQFPSGGAPQAPQAPQAPRAPQPVTPGPN